MLVLTDSDYLAIERSYCASSLRNFAERAWPILEPATDLKWGWAVDAICDHLEAVTTGQINRLLINVPPGTMKSLLTAVIWPAWEWGPLEMQNMRYLGTAHKQDLAVRDSTKCRRLIQSDWYQRLWPVKLTGDQNAKTKFENNKTGFREAMAFASMTGSRGDRVILDDPHSVDDANSRVKLASDIATFREALPSRVNNEKSAIVIIMQRLAVGDVSDVALELGYDHLRIPMRYEPGRSTHTVGTGDKRTVDGELMFPERFDEGQVCELEKSLGSYATAGQLQQRPVMRGGGMIKDAWVQRYNTAPANKIRIVQSWDTAYKAAQINDPSACTTWLQTTNGYYLIDAFTIMAEYPAVKRAIKSKYEQFTPDAVLIEDKSSGQSLLQELRADSNIPVIAIKPEQDKETRLNAVSSLFESGLIYLPESSPWLTDYESELFLFPAGGHDDQVDSTSQALAWMRKRVGKNNYATAGGRAF